MAEAVSLLTEVPTDLLVLIAATLSIRDPAALKRLRLTCRCFAYSPAILEKMFCRMTLRHTKTSTSVLGDSGFKKIAPYVRVLVFRPALYAAHMSRDFFEVTLMIQNAIHKSRERLHYYKYTKPELDSGYENYQRHILEARGTRTDRIWETALVAMGNLTTIVFDYDSRRYYKEVERLKSGICTLLPCHTHSRRIVNQRCGNIAAQSDEQFLERVLATLTRARIRPTHLQIKHDAILNFGELPDWYDFDLSTLETLDFRSCTCPSDESSKQDESTTAAELLAQLQRRCSASLKKLKIRPHDFPCGSDLTVMPRLTRLELKYSGIYVTSFARFISIQPQLEYLTLRWTKSISKSGNWFAVWNAIRDHKNRMFLEFDGINCNGWREIEILHWTGSASKLKAPAVDTADEDDDDNSFLTPTQSEYMFIELENYLSALGDWTEYLKSEFPLCEE